MDIELLRTFVQVAKSQHFRKAAEILYLTPSAVSARIKQLEERLGTPLLNRDKHQVSLTPAGERFLEHAKQMSSIWYRACQEATLSGTVKSSIVVGSTDTLWSSFLTRWLGEMRQEHPECSLWAELHTVDTLISALLHGMLDVVVSFDIPVLPRLTIKELAMMDFVLVSDVKNIGVEQAMGAGYIAVDWGDAFAASLYQQLGFGSIAGVHTNVGKLAYAMIEQGGGSAYLPRGMVKADLAVGRMFVVEDAPIMSRPVYAAALTEQYESHGRLVTGIEMMGRSVQIALV
ncbi:MAG: LysR family transcriptional regulator [Zetaproteobacteria bacterium]|nr:LysR family transcriptional regulator [Zetaproteobacteria bacterium]